MGVVGVTVVWALQMSASGTSSTVLEPGFSLSITQTETHYWLASSACNGAQVCT